MGNRTYITYIVAGLIAVSVAPTAPAGARSGGGAFRPVSRIEFALPGKPDGALEVANWWRSFGGRYPDARPPAPLTWDPVLAASSRNHVDYMAWLATIGSDYCGHGFDPDHPPPDVDRTHHVLFCGLPETSAAIDGWLATPLHGRGFLAPRSASMGAASSSRASAAAIRADLGRPQTDTYVYPAPGGVIPLLRWWGSEIPNPAAACPPDGINGPPIHAFLPTYTIRRAGAGDSSRTSTRRRVVSASLTTASGRSVPACLMERTTVLGAGDEVGDHVYLFPRAPLVDGETYRAAIELEPAVDRGEKVIKGNGRVRLDWTFRAVDGDMARRGPRLLDTRDPFASGDAGSSGDSGIVSIPVGSMAGLDSDTTAVALHVVAVAPTANGFVTVWPCGEPRPRAASLNYRAGTNRGSTVITKLGRGGTACVFTRTPVDVVVDFVGAFDGAYRSLTPYRVLDTRPGAGRIGYDGPRPGGSTVRLDLAGVVPRGEAVGLTVIAVDPSDRGFVTVWPCDQPRPEAANLNYVAGQTVANSVIAQPSSSGEVCLYTRSPAHLVADLNGFVGDGYDGHSPERVLDTRAPASGGRPAAGSVTAFRPRTSGASSVVLNVAAVDPSDRGFLVVWPCDRPRPSVSTLNYTRGGVVPNLAISEVAADGTVCIYSRAATDLVVDQQGVLP